MPYDTLPIQVINPVKLPAWQIPAQRTAVGVAGDYKPSVALLPNGELVMVAFFQTWISEDKVHESTLLWRSSDGGVTWSERRVLEDVIGREQWITCTSDGTLFLTCHLLEADTSNTLGVCHCYVHRSVDGGMTWERTRIALDEDELAGLELHYEYASLPPVVMTSRNIVELCDGTLLLGVGVIASNYAALWKSEDGGKTWVKTPKSKIAGYYDNLDAFFTEDFTYVTTSGKMLHFIRVGHPSPMAKIADARANPADGFDQNDRSMICESNDGGRTWVRLRDFGDYGIMYCKVLRLRDGRLLLTYTQRSLIPPLGLRAVLSYDDGETWDFSSDRIIIEGKTPWGMPSGGGFGNTVQLEDGKLVSCYSYRGTDEQTYVETVRWSLG
jgi:hypothetical protein